MSMGTEAAARLYRDLLKRGARTLTPEGVPWSQSNFLVVLFNQSSLSVELD
jgi:hypothetical protein